MASLLVVEAAAGCCRHQASAVCPLLGSWAVGPSVFPLAVLAHWAKRCLPGLVALQVRVTGQPPITKPAAVCCCCEGSPCLSSTLQGIVNKAAQK